MIESLVGHVQFQLLGGLGGQITVIDHRGLTDLPQPGVESVILTGVGEIVEREIEFPVQYPFVGFLLDIVVQYFLFELAFTRFNLVIIQKILIIRYIFGRIAGIKKNRNDQGNNVWNPSSQSIS